MKAILKALCILTVAHVYASTVKSTVMPIVAGVVTVVKKPGGCLAGVNATTAQIATGVSVETQRVLVSAVKTVMTSQGLIAVAPNVLNVKKNNLIAVALTKTAQDAAA